jgi:hypothetical protein
MTDKDDGLQALYGQAIVIDAVSEYVFLGRLVDSDHRYLVLEDADVHDLRETNTTREFYVLEARQHGINANRKRVFVRRNEVVSVSRLDDVVS